MIRGADFWHETPGYLMHFPPILGVEIIEKQTGRKMKASGWIRTELKALALQCDDAKIEAAIREIDTPPHSATKTSACASASTSR